MATFLAGVRLQFSLVRATPDHWMTVVLNPFLAVVFLAIVRHAGRDDLVGAAVLAPVLYCLIQMSLLVSGATIEKDRWAGTLEPAIAAPAPLVVSLAGRIVAVTFVASTAFVETWLVARVLFGVTVSVHHPVVFLAAVVSLWFAMATAALLMASVFVLARGAQVFQNSLSFPLFVLGGVMVPVALLPFWARPAARLVFMSWSSDLLRDALDPAPVSDVVPRIAVILALGLGMLGLARWMLARIVDRVRRDGTVTYA